MLAGAAGKVARFGKQLAVLSFAGSFGAALPEHAEFLRIQALAPLSVRELEGKLALCTGHEGAVTGTGV